MRHLNGGSILVHIGTNNADMEVTTVIVGEMQEPTEQDEKRRVGQIILSGILPVFGSRPQGYNNSRGCQSPD